MVLLCWPLVILISLFIFFITLKLLPEDNFCVLCTNMHKFDFDFKQELPLQHSFKYLQICALLVLLLFSSFFFFCDRISCSSGRHWTTDPSSFHLLSAGMTGICHHAWKSSVTKSVLGTKRFWLGFTGIIYWQTLKSFISFSTHFVFFSYKNYQNNSSNSKVINSFA